MIIRIKNLKAQAIIGVFDWEKKAPRELIINVEMEFDGSKAAKSDKLEDTLCYDTISQMIIKEAANTNYDLIEKLADDLLDRIMADKRIVRAKIEIDKPGAVKEAESVSVELEKRND